VNKEKRRKEIMEIGEPGLGVYSLRVAAECKPCEQCANSEGETELARYCSNSKACSQYGNGYTGFGVCPALTESGEA